VTSAESCTRVAVVTIRLPPTFVCGCDNRSIVSQLNYGKPGLLWLTSLTLISRSLFQATPTFSVLNLYYSLIGVLPTLKCLLGIKPGLLMFDVG